MTHVGNHQVSTNQKTGYDTARLATLTVVYKEEV